MSGETNRPEKRRTHGALSEFSPLPPADAVKGLPRTLSEISPALADVARLANELGLPASPPKTGAAATHEALAKLDAIDYAGPTSAAELQDLARFLGMPPEEIATRSAAELEAWCRERLKLRRQVAAAGQPIVLAAHGIAYGGTGLQERLRGKDAEIARKDAALDELVKRLPAVPPAAKEGEPPGSVSNQPTSQDSLARLLTLYTGNVADDRIKQAADVLAGGGTVNDKLEALDKAMKIPATASARNLAEALEVSHRAVMNTAWWKRNRAGRQAEIIAEREGRMTERGKGWE